MKITKHLLVSALMMLLLCIVGYAQTDSLTAGMTEKELAANTAGFVFVGTNHNNTSDSREPPNQVVMYRRLNSGALSLVGYYDTGGQGSGPGQRFAGDGLGAAHSVQLSQDKNFLFVTNAGSNEVSVFRIRRNRLELTDIQPTGNGNMNQRFPNSVTQHGNLVYVLNSADQGSITGFLWDGQGHLTPLSNSRRRLQANQDRFAPDALYNPTQVSFTPNGRQLVVTIKDGPALGAIPGVIPTGPGRVLVFSVGSDGRPSTTFTRTDLNNHGPFGFSFDNNGNLLIALFVGGPNLTGAAGSFRINANGSLTPLSRLVPNTQLDTCWLENNGRYAYGANYSSNTISSYRIRANGRLDLLAAVAGTTEGNGYTQGSTPLDLRTSPDGQFLYNVLPGSGKVAGWCINENGSLTKIGEFPGLPRTVNGDMAPFDFSALGSPAGIDIN